MRRRCCMLTCVAATTMASAQPAPISAARVQGEIVVGSRHFAARDALAFRERFLPTLVVSDRAFDFDRMLADGRIDLADLREHRAAGGSVLRLGLAGFYRVPTVLAWEPADGTAALLLDGAVLHTGFQLAREPGGRLRGALDLEPDAATGTLRVAVRFDVLELQAYLAETALLPLGGGAPGEALRAVLTRVADPADLAWPTALDADFLRRLQQGLGARELDIATLATRYRSWVPQGPTQWHGVQGRDEARLDFTAADGRHWAARLAGKAGSAWRLTDLRPLPALPQPDALYSNVDTVAQADAVTVQSRNQRNAKLALALSPLLLLVLWLCWRFWRSRRQAGWLQRHGVDVRARVIDVESVAWQVNGHALARLHLAWLDPDSGRTHRIRTPALVLPGKAKRLMREVQLADCRARLAQFGAVSVRVDPDAPTRRYQITDLEKLRSVIRAGDA